MAYIAPNSLIKLCRGVPWNDTYQDTVYYADATAQFNAISAKAKYTFTAQSYQRAGKNSIKLNVLADNIYDCNYMMFQNTSYSNKWFYAFITKIDYINNDTTLIEYEIDVLQTWAFDYTLEQCFIERQHTTTDSVGDNLVEEDLEIGELVFAGSPSTETHTSTSYQPIVAATFNATWDGSDWTIDRTGGGAQYNGCYSGLYLINLYNAARANAFLAKVTEELVEENIVGFFMYPSDFLASAGGGVIYYDNAITVAKPGIDGTFPAISGYVPHNHKIYTYPFSQLLVTDGGQMSVPLRYENFAASPCSFRLIGETAVNPTVCLMPVGYKGVSGSDAYNAILMTGFPMCAYSTDMFKAYIAQTYGPALASVTPEHSASADTAAGAAMGAAAVTSTAMGAAATVASKFGGAFSAAQQIADEVRASTRQFLNGFQAHGNTSDTCLVNFGFKGFKVYQMVMKYDYAVMVDNYFTMYGYAMKRIGVPNRHARPHWTYIKTIGCKIDASIPFDHESIICSIYDRGVTFWNSIADYGNYSLNNSPT